MSEHASGAYTGEIAAGMLKEFSVRYVILGHSERRQFQKESDELIAKKAVAAHAASLKPIVCVGEMLEERESGRTEKVVGAQLQGSLAGLSKAQMEETIIAYEPCGRSAPAKPPPRRRRRRCMPFIRDRVEKLFNETVGAARADSVWRQREAVECARA